MYKTAILFIVSVQVIGQVAGHGMMLDPPNRSSLWRFNKTHPINYNDNQNWCGGLWKLWQINGGNCGVCGDEYEVPHPQPNENTGIYGTGTIVAEYSVGQVIDTSILLTANHRGHFEYHLCQITNSELHETGEECFQLLRFEDGSDKFMVASSDREVHNRIQLPEGFACEHCVLRWHYRAGNNWGICEDGTGALGCGIQEYFRSCSDIRIQ